MAIPISTSAGLSAGSLPLAGSSAAMTPIAPNAAIMARGMDGLESAVIADVEREVRERVSTQIPQGFMGGARFRELSREGDTAAKMLSPAMADISEGSACLAFGIIPTDATVFQTGLRQP